MVEIQASVEDSTSMSVCSSAQSVNQPGAPRADPSPCPWSTNAGFKEWTRDPRVVYTNAVHRVGSARIATAVEMATSGELIPVKSSLWPGGGTPLPRKTRWA